MTLSVGCSTSSKISVYLVEEWRIIGKVEEARKRYPNLSFRVGDAEDPATIAEIDAKFDYILVLDTIGSLEDIQKFCEQHLPGKYRIQIIDLLKDPSLSASDQVMAIPTLVRKLPEPIRKIIGDLSNSERVLVGLDLRPGN